VRTLVLFAILSGAACGRDSQPAAGGARVDNHELPPWSALPMASAEVARPQPWVADGRPTLLMFTASWCPSCPASLLTDVAIAHAYGERFQVGVGLVDDKDEDFASAPMAKLLAGVPVWSADSVRGFARQCGAATIPIACLVDRGRVVFRGATVSARHVLDAYYDKTLDTVLSADVAAHASVVAKLGMGVGRADIPDIVKGTHSDPGWQSAIAWQLASQQDASATDVALAVALARDAVAADGGLDYSHLDTYALALSKAGLAEDAALVSWRVLNVCSIVRSECMVERHRAYAYIYYARETGLRWRE